MHWREAFHWRWSELSSRFFWKSDKGFDKGLTNCEKPRRCTTCWEMCVFSRPNELLNTFNRFQHFLTSMTYLAWQPSRNFRTPGPTAQCHHLTVDRRNLGPQGMLLNPLNNEINYQPQLVSLPDFRTINFNRYYTPENYLVPLKRDHFNRNDIFKPLIFREQPLVFWWGRLLATMDQNPWNSMISPGVEPRRAFIFFTWTLRNRMFGEKSPVFKKDVSCG